MREERYAWIEQRSALADSGQQYIDDSDRTQAIALVGMSTCSIAKGATQSHRSSCASENGYCCFSSCLTQSAIVGLVGDAYDNAICEGFFATLECELLARRRFGSQAEARMAVFRFIEGWYNPSRRHSGLGYLSPIAYEEMMQAEP